MEWWIWLVIVLACVIMLADWFIVMGIHPKEWKGGKKK